MSCYVNTTQKIHTVVRCKFNNEFSTLYIYFIDVIETIVKFPSSIVSRDIITKVYSGKSNWPKLLTGIFLFPCKRVFISQMTELYCRVGREKKRQRTRVNSTFGSFSRHALEQGGNKSKNTTAGQSWKFDVIDTPPPGRTCRKPVMRGRICIWTILIYISPDGTSRQRRNSSSRCKRTPAEQDISFV